MALIVNKNGANTTLSSSATLKCGSTNLTKIVVVQGGVSTTVWESHVHNYTYSYTNVSTGTHRAYCSCGEYITESCTPGNWTATNDGRHAGTCTKCGYGGLVYSHTASGRYGKDSSGHWRICSVCGMRAETTQTTVTAHTYSNGICTVCGYRDSTAHTHSYNDRYVSKDRSYHYAYCSCGAVQKVAHSWRNFTTFNHTCTYCNRVLTIDDIVKDGTEAYCCLHGIVEAELDSNGNGSSVCGPVTQYYCGNRGEHTPLANLPLNFVLEGENTVLANADGSEYAFTAEESGRYKIYSNDSNAAIGKKAKNDDIEFFEGPQFEVNLQDGEQVIIICATNDWTDDSYTLIIEKL